MEATGARASDLSSSPPADSQKATIEGYVYNSVTNLPVADVPVFASGASYNFTHDDRCILVTTLCNLIAGSYDLTAGPLLPGYPGTDVVNGVSVSAGDTTTSGFLPRSSAFPGPRGYAARRPEWERQWLPRTG